MSRVGFDGSMDAAGIVGRDPEAMRAYHRWLNKRRAEWHCDNAPLIERKRKVCPRCERRRNIGSFNLALGQPDCVRPYCRECDRTIIRNMTRNDPRQRTSRVKQDPELLAQVRERVDARQ